MNQNTKDAVIELIRQMPDDATMTDIIAKLHFRQHVDEGLRQLDNGEGIETEEVEKRLSRWF